MKADDERRRGIDGLHPSDFDIPRSLVGETIEVLPGILLQRPSQEIIESLKGADSRIKYVAADLTKVNSGDPPDLLNLRDQHEALFKKIVVPPLNVMIKEDFSQTDEVDLFLRGIVVSLRDEFPCFPTREYIPGKGFSRKQVENALTILAKGSEGLQDSPRTDDFRNGRINFYAQSYMYDHTKKALTSLLGIRDPWDSRDPQLADNLFPGLMVYTRPTIRNWRDIPPTSRIAAFYITDRVVPKRA